MKKLEELEELSYQQLLDIEAETKQNISNKLADARDFYKHKLEPLYDKKSVLSENIEKYKMEINSLYEKYNYKNKNWLIKYENSYPLSKKISLLIIISYYLGAFFIATI